MESQITQSSTQATLQQNPQPVTTVKKSKCHQPSCNERPVKIVGGKLSLVILI